MSGENITIFANETHGSEDNGEWVQDIRFALEGVTQGIVGLAGLLGKMIYLFALYFDHKMRTTKNCILNQFFELLKNKLFPFCNCIRVCIQCNAIAFIRFGYISPLFPTHISRHLLMQMDNVFLSFYILLFMIIGKIWKMGLRKWAYIDY